MTDVGTAALQIIPSFQGFQGKLEHGSAGAMIAAGTSGGAKYGDSAGRSMASRFSSHVKTAALAGSAALATAGYALFKLGKDSIAEAREAQKVGALTASTIKATGGAANVTAKQVGDLAGALSLKTGVDDEVIQRGANMLLTFKNVRDEVGKNNDIFSQSVAITEDMAAAMAGGQGGDLDLKSSSILVGKALNDPIKGLTALSRVGVTFTEQQKEQIGALIESGKRMDAQKVILGELKSEFGGAAAAQATLGEKVNVAWGNIEEKLGTALLPLVEKAERAFLKKGVPAIEGWVDAFQNKGIPAIKHFYDQAKPVAEEVLPALGSVLGTVRDVLADAAPYARDLVDAFNDMPDWAKKGVVTGGLGLYASSKLGMGPLSKGGSTASLLGGISKSAPLPVYVVNGGVPLPGGKTPTGTPIVTPGSPDAPKQPGRVKRFGNFAAGTAATFFGPQLVNEAIAEIKWPFTEGPFKPAEVKDAETAMHGLNRVMGITNQTAEDTVAKWSGLGSTFHSTTGQSDKLGASLHGIPKTVASKVSTPGVVEARRDVLGLTRQLVDAAKPRQGRVSVDTSAAEANLNRVLNLMNAINKQGAINAERGIPAAPHAQVAPRRGATINVHLDGKVVGSVVDERIGTYDDLAQEKGRANR